MPSPKDNSDLNQRLLRFLSTGKLSADQLPELTSEVLQKIQVLIDTSRTNTERINELNNALINYSHFEFSEPAPISEAADDIDALALGLNTLAEEFNYYKTRSDKNDNFLNMAQRLGRIGSWIYYEDSGKSELSATLLDIYGRSEKISRTLTSLLGP